MTLGARITQYRKAQGLSQEALAEAVGVSRQAVSKWELNEAQPDAAKIVLLAQALGVTTDQLLLDPPSDAPLTLPDTPTSPPQSGHLNALTRLVKRHGYKAGYILIAYGLVLILFAGCGLALFHGFFIAADESLSDFDRFSTNTGTHFGYDGHVGVTIKPAPGVSLSPEEIAVIEQATQDHHPEEHHSEYHDSGALTTSQVEAHAFPLPLQRAVYFVLTIPAIMGMALVVTGIVIVVKYKGKE